MIQGEDKESRDDPVYFLVCINASFAGQLNVLPISSQVRMDFVIKQEAAQAFQMCLDYLQCGIIDYLQFGIIYSVP